MKLIWGKQNGSYAEYNHPPSRNDDFYFRELGNSVEIYSSTYDKFSPIGDLIAEESESYLTQLPDDVYNAKNLLPKKLCFKHKDNPSYID